ncbi:hypothetical protein SeLEV6574_g04065 [Synchytrium endobioticum]|nr:hypothetical protein SeLEV6574_g04065 [Synchytrium endobioticum]
MPKATVVKKSESVKNTPGKKGTSAYNVYMKETLKEIKDANPGIEHRTAFSRAANGWKESPKNPKNQASAQE